MSSMLRQVLTVFETYHGSLSLQEMARVLKVEPGLLEGMIDYWIGKGKIREVSQSADQCQTCGTSSGGCHGCPFIMQLPRRYELATDDEFPSPKLPISSQHCCH